MYGTGIQNFIHVMGLVEGHVVSLAKLKPGIHIYILGTGEGTSVLRLVHAFEEFNQLEIPYEIVGWFPAILLNITLTPIRRKKIWAGQLNVLW